MENFLIISEKECTDIVAETMLKAIYQYYKWNNGEDDIVKMALESMPTIEHTIRLYNRLNNSKHCIDYIFNIKDAKYEFV